MTLREFYVQRRKAELPLFVEVLQALPPGKLDYKPAEKSPSAIQIAWTMMSPISRSVGQLLGRFSPEQWATLRDGKTLTLSTDYPRVSAETSFCLPTFLRATLWRRRWNFS